MVTDHLITFFFVLFRILVFRGRSGVYMAPRYWEWFLDLVVLPLQPEAVLELIFLVSFEDEWPYQEPNEEEDVVGPEMHLPSVEDNHELLKKPEVLHHAHLHAHRPCLPSAVPGKTHRDELFAFYSSCINSTSGSDDRKASERN